MSAAGGAPALRLDGVSKRYGRLSVVRDVSLSVAPGRVWTVRGSNGSGKSTLLRLAAGLARPSSGRVEVSGPRAYVPATVVMPRRTPLRQLLLGLRTMAGAVADLDDALELLGCRHHLDRPAGDLSTGTALKALIAQALTSRADLVVLDEPAAHLDDSGAAGLVRLVEQACARGAAVLTAGASGALPSAATAEIVEGRVVVRDLEHGTEAD